jgi:hypothetical protein
MARTAVTAKSGATTKTSAVEKSAAATKTDAVEKIDVATKTGVKRPAGHETLWRLHGNRRGGPDLRPLRFFLAINNPIVASIRLRQQMPER